MFWRKNKETEYWKERCRRLEEMFQEERQLFFKAMDLAESYRAHTRTLSDALYERLTPEEKEIVDLERLYRS